MKATRALVFKTALGPAEAKRGECSLHAVEIEVPQHIMEEAADRYLTILLQSKLRQGTGNYGELQFGKEVLCFKSVTLSKELVKELKEKTT